MLADSRGVYWPSRGTGSTAGGEGGAIRGDAPPPAARGGHEPGEEASGARAGLALAEEPRPPGGGSRRD